MLKLSNFAEKLRRQGVIMKDAATVLLCHDMTRRKKSVMILEMSFPKPGGHVLSPDFGQIRRWAASEMGLKDIRVEDL